MKRIFCIIALVVSFFNVAQAQEKITIKDNFTGARFDWNEFFDKKKDQSVVLQGEKLVLTNKDDKASVLARCNLPVLIDEDGRIGDFKLTVVFDKPEVNDEDDFGIVFNYEDRENYCLFSVREGIAFFGRYVDGKYRPITESSKIVLAKGKKKDVELTVEKKGRFLIFGNDNMEIMKEEWHLFTRRFGIYKFGKGTLAVKSAEVEQWGEQ